MSVKPGKRQVLVHLVEGRLGGDDVQGGQGSNPVRVVQGHPVTDAGAPIMAHDVEGVEAEPDHDRDLVVGRGPLAVDAQVARGRGRFAAISIAAQVGRDDREMQRSGVFQAPTGSGVFQAPTGSGVFPGADGSGVFQAPISRVTTEGKITGRP